MNQTEAMQALSQIEADENKRKNDFTVSFCGVFSSGKSSILNYFLDCADFKLPVGVFPITKVVTRIRYGKNVKFYCLIGRAGNLRAISKDKFERMVVGKAPLPSDCTEILIEAPSKILRNGVVFIDTPGFLDEMGGDLEQVSRDAVLRSDMAIFCASAASLGHQFEREFITDLDACIGNYCMVVNRMDCCNTEEDEENVEKKATFLMKGKGGSYLSNLFGRTYFFTIADGPHKTLRGFDSYLSYALTDMELRSDLKKTSSKKIREYRVNKIRDEIDLEILELQEKLEDVNAKHSAKLKTIKQENSLRNIENIEKQQVFREKYYAKLDIATCQVKKKIQFLSASDFSKNVDLDMRVQYARIFDEAEQERTNNQHLHSQAIVHILSAFSVPEPRWERKRRLSLLERINGVVSDLLNYGAIIDDGWVYGYNDYQTAAIQKISQELTPRLEKELDHMTESAFFVQLLPEYSGFENQIDMLKSKIASWEDIRSRCVVEE